MGTENFLSKYFRPLSPNHRQTRKAAIVMSTNHDGLSTVLIRRGVLEPHRWMKNGRDRFVTAENSQSGRLQRISDERVQAKQQAPLKLQGEQCS
jgi:hypothetical protein